MFHVGEISTVICCNDMANTEKLNMISSSFELNLGREMIERSVIMDGNMIKHSRQLS